MFLCHEVLSQVRLYLSALGIFACILGLGASIGLMFLFGLEYNQTHNILPFIAIGKTFTM